MRRWHHVEQGKALWSNLDKVFKKAAKKIAGLGDPITGLTEVMAAEQKARAIYEHLIAATGISYPDSISRYFLR